MNSNITRCAADLIYLVSCAVNLEKPDTDRVQKMDLDALYSFAQDHSLLCVCAYALEDAGIVDERFAQAKAKALRKAALFDIETKKILSGLEREGIWYMPLKGSVIKDCYPRFGMREMSDVDILCDPDRMEDVRTLMEREGYTCGHFGEATDDAYFKQPTLNFEMHRRLFSETDYVELGEYYDEVKQRLQKDDNNSYGYHFSGGDLYLYLIAHEYKHYVFAGTGLRSLLDIYLFLKKKRDTLDFDYIESEAQKLGIADFEKMNREMSERIFSAGAFCEETAAELGYVLHSGVYGNAGVRDYNHLYYRLGGKDDASSKFRYLLGRVFIGGADLKYRYPFFYRHKYLLPFLYLYRPLKGLKNIRSVSAETKTVAGFKVKEDDDSIKL